MNQKSVFGVLLNWNGLEHLKYCLPALLKTDYKNFMIILVDNGSTDGSLDYVKKNFDIKKIKIIALAKNYGYSKGMNTGIEYCLKKRADFICTINSDTMVDPRWINESLKVFENNKKIGVIGYDLLGMEIRGDVKRFEREKKKRNEFSFEYKNYILDAVMMARAEVFKTVGVFDEKYISYGEEEDLFQRIHLAGFRIVELSVPTYHYGHGTADKIPLRAGYLMMRNSIRYAIKWLSITELVKRALYIFHVACNPFAKIDKTNLVATKLRPSNIFVNFFIYTKAILWNLIFLCQTLSIRNIERKMIKNKR